MAEDLSDTVVGPGSVGAGALDVGPDSAGAGALDYGVRTPPRRLAILNYPVARVVARRAMLAIPILFVASALSFALVALRPGDAAWSLVGLESSGETREQLRHDLGLDSPVYVQYGRWLTQAGHGDLGMSLITSERVTDAIHARLPVTLSLVLGALLVSIVVGVGFGILSAAPGGFLGWVADAFVLVGYALPSFWVGAALITLFAVELRWLPATGYVSLTDSPTGWLGSIALPVLALAWSGVAVVAKQTREAMLDALSSEYIRMARASGVSRSSIVFRHALKNSAIRVVTVLGLLAVGLLGGTIFVETVFSIPGLGGLAVKAATEHDLPVIQGVVLYFTVIVIAVNLLIDVAYIVLDPRVRTG